MYRFLLALTMLALTMACLSFTAHAAPEPVVDYGFAGSLTSLHRNAPVLKPIDPGSSFIDDVVDGRPVMGLAFPEGAGLLVSTTDLIPSDTYSVAILMEFDQTSSYAKILDTKSLTSDHGLYVDSSNLAFYSFASANTGAFTANTPLQVVVTRAADRAYRGYINGIEQFNFMDTVAEAIIYPGQLMFFRDDSDTGNSENSAGTVYRIRIYDHALSAQEVADLETDRLTPAVFVGSFEKLP